MPPVVQRMAGGDDVVAVWTTPQCMTFAIGVPRPTRYVKWAAAGSTADLRSEAAKLQWAGRYTPVPEVFEVESDDSGSWLLTQAIDAENAVTPRWKAAPAVAVRAIGEGLRALHDALPVGDCPFTWSASDRVARADSARRHEVADVPAIDRLVVCHGDTCAPNTLIGDDGRWRGHVDFGALGVADRWADLAVATYSTTWNYGPGWEIPLLDAYGIDEDAERTRYYRLLWDLTP